MSIAYKKDPAGADAAMVSIAGSMTIEHGDEIRSVLMKALEEASRVELDLEEVDQVDLVGLQFICSLHRTAVRGKKRVMVRGMRQKIMQEAALAAGFIRHVGCALDIEHTCIWIGGGE